MAGGECARRQGKQTGPGWDYGMQGPRTGPSSLSVHYTDRTAVLATVKAQLLLKAVRRMKNTEAANVEIEMVSAVHSDHTGQEL